MNGACTAAAHRMRRTIASQLGAVDECCRDVEAMLGHEGLGSQTFAVGLMLREALNNAVVHGNHQDPAKSVRVEVFCGRRWITLRVRDQGRGFDWKSQELHRPRETATCGRGLSIYHLFAERVKFNAAGNEIALWRSRKEDEVL
jgi:serine/threonine-protein kinase RsbW